jgi:hypothetical protein
MTASALSNGGGRVTVLLHQIPKNLRLTVAHELASKWRLKGMDYALFLLAAETPKEDPHLRVPADKAALVFAGKRPLGSLPDELRIPPVLGHE